MNPSFIILVWHSSAGRERARAVELRHAPALEAFARGRNTVVLARADLPRSTGRPDGMMVLGELHGRIQVDSGDGPIGRLRHLTGQAWGAYVAFSPDENGGYAMVDPSGAGRAHIARDQDLVMVADIIDPDLVRTSGFMIDVDLMMLAGCLLDPGTMVTASLLHGIDAMVPGTAYSLTSAGSPIELWSPARLACNEETDAETLRQAVDRAVGAMAGTGAPLIELSGGLDSSIIAGTSIDLGIEARAVTVEMIGGDVDELRYAAATADRCGMVLHKGRTTAYPNYAIFMEAGQVAHPYMYGIDDAFARVVMDAAGDADRIVTGQGGDAVFFQPATPLTTIDRFRALGLRSGWHALLDDARRTRASIWHHLLPVVADRAIPAGPPQDELAGALLARDAREARTRFVHPWCKAAQHLPPGRRLQILMLANSLIFHSVRPVEIGVPLVHPLLAQPVLEAALAIPTWQLASGPLDRGLARRTFADRLHPDVAARCSKGEAAAFYSRAAVANLPYLRERLLDGELAKAGIIDRAAMEHALTPEYLFHSLDYRALVLHAGCEAWLNAWMA